MFWSSLKDAVKKYWKILFGIVLAVLGMFAFRKKPDVEAVLNNERESNQKELDAIESANELLKNKTRDAEYLYKKTVEEIEKKYSEEQSVMSEEVRDKVKRIIDEHKEDPTEITRRISELTGYEIYVEED